MIGNEGSDYYSEINAKNESEKLYATVEDNDIQRNLLVYLIGDDNDERIITEDFMREVVDYIIGEPDYRLIHFLYYYPLLTHFIVNH